MGLVSEVRACKLCEGCSTTDFVKSAYAAKAGKLTLKKPSILWVCQPPEAYHTAIPHLYKLLGRCVPKHVIVAPAVGFYDSVKPKKRQVENCRQHLLRYVASVDAPVTVVVGNPVAKMLAGERASLPATLNGSTLPIMGVDRPIFLLPEFSGITDPKDGAFNFSRILGELDRFITYCDTAMKGAVRG